MLGTAQPDGRLLGEGESELRQYFSPSVDKSTLN